jgi:hypothetical protein
MQVHLLPNYYINAFKLKIQNGSYENVLLFHLHPATPLANHVLLALYDAPWRIA